MSMQYLAVISDQHITERGTKLHGLDTNTCAEGLFTELAEARLPMEPPRKGLGGYTTAVPLSTNLGRVMF
jgi:hypothetical protein